MMARYRIKGVDLAEEMGMSTNSISNLRKADSLPRIDGHTLNSLCMSLRRLSRVDITPTDLIEFIVDDEGAETR
ncbi:helix-turn-helix transcriptional regulator [Acaryochloris sp. IP29b_bin.137]|uniref:helix-turn-helix domain-containing protein n=1 Tax=Acaryochloris sp. IP29b_bin.137 TaxID=2969217 RepID=UPI00262FC35D|nr:helix-turn-helix transcriptional regulator [Acaryochloris sp. IP29b_bin.137]